MNNHLEIEMNKSTESMGTTLGLELDEGEQMILHIER
jgi:hypothetical protein